MTQSGTRKSSSYNSSDEKVRGSPAEPAENFEVSEKDLPAGVAYADSTGTEANSNIFSSFIWPVIFLVFLSIATVGVYFIRQKKYAHAPGGEFEILDE
jgi:hypothetical protein